jgi:hypothetical protein
MLNERQLSTLSVLKAAIPLTADTVEKLRNRAFPEMFGMQTASNVRKLVAQQIRCKRPTLLKWLQTWSLTSLNFGRILDPENRGLRVFQHYRPASSAVRPFRSSITTLPLPESRRLKTSRRSRSRQKDSPRRHSIRSVVMRRSRSSPHRWLYLLLRRLTIREAQGDPESAALKPSRV